MSVRNKVREKQSERRRVSAWFLEPQQGEGLAFVN